MKASFADSFYREKVAFPNQDNTLASQELFNAVAHGAETAREIIFFHEIRAAWPSGPVGCVALFCRWHLVGRNLCFLILRGMHVISPSTECLDILLCVVSDWRGLTQKKRERSGKMAWCEHARRTNSCERRKLVRPSSTNSSTTRSFLSNYFLTITTKLIFLWWEHWRYFGSNPLQC